MVYILYSTIFFIGFLDLDLNVMPIEVRFNNGETLVLPEEQVNLPINDSQNRRNRSKPILNPASTKTTRTDETDH